MTSGVVVARVVDNDQRRTCACRLPRRRRPSLWVMASRSAQSRRASQDASVLLKTPERARRSLSQGDDTPRPTGVLFGASAGNIQNNDSGSPPNPHPLPEPTPPTKRLGFLSEKLSLSSNSGSSSATLRALSPAPSLLPSRSHTRAESALNIISREAAASPTPGMAAPPPQTAKGHASPSKVSHSVGCDEQTPGHNYPLPPKRTALLSVFHLLTASAPLRHQ